MAKIYGQLEQAQAENVSADPSGGKAGRLVWNYTDAKFRIDNGTTYKEITVNDSTQTLTNKTLVVASNTITTAASGNLAAVELNAALAELQTDIDTRLATGGGTMSGALLIPDGSSGSPSVAFSDDTNTGVYSSANDALDIVAGSYRGIQVKKSTGNYANVGIGTDSNASVSDSYPLLIERTVAGAVIQQISNPSSDSTASSKIQLSVDAGDKLGELAVYPNEATTFAYTSAFVVRPNGNAAKLTLVGGDLSTGHVSVQVAGDYTSSGESLRFAADKSIQFMQQIATPTTPASGSGKLYTKSDDKLYFLNDAGTETDLISKALAYSDINSLTEDTTPAIGDYVITGDISATSTKKVQLDNVFKVVNGLTAETAVAMSTDLVPIYDASATAPRKMTVDNLLAGVRPYFYVDKNSTNQTGIGASSTTKVTWGRELSDTNSNFASNTFTCSVAGIYMFAASVGWTATVDTSRSTVHIYKNGGEQVKVQTLQSTNQPHGVQISAIINLAVSDTVDIYATQYTGSSQDIDGGNSTTWFMGMRLV
jgi:hypothetical protein